MVGIEVSSNTTGVIGIISNFIELYNNVMSSLSPAASTIINMFMLVFAILIYCLFVWNFYKLVSRKNIFNLNLNKYNNSKHPFFNKFLHSIFYILEYIIVLPILIFFSIIAFSIFILFMNEGLDVSLILLMAVSIVAVVRVTSYYTENLSKDIAKLLPFTLLAIALTKGSVFSMEKIVSNLNQLPLLFNNFIYYLLFIVFLELGLRILDFIYSISGIRNVEGK